MMMEDIVLIGYGGHAKSVEDTIERQKQYNIIGYTDVNKHHSKYTYLGTDDELENLFQSGIKNAAICIGYLGKGQVREFIYKKLKSIGFSLPIIIDPSAIISDNAVIHEGTFIGKGVIINSESSIGKCCIINTGAIIEHETKVDDFSHISVSSVLCGQAKIGRGAFVGANATIIQCIEVGDNEIVPAGSTKRNNNTVFGSVIYEKALDYIDEFIDSINRQDHQHFDVLLINDDIKDSGVLERIKKRILNRKVIIVDKTSDDANPATLRVELLKQAKKRGYKLLVIGDCDDTFASNRVTKLYEAFINHGEVAFFYNDLKLEDGSVVIDIMPRKIDNISELMQSNFIGMSNSAINLQKIDVDFIDSLLDFNAFVFDWYLYSRLLLAKKRGIYVSDTATIYRIYDNNFAGVNNLSVESIRKEMEVKKSHYRALAKYDNRFQQLYDKVSALKIETLEISNRNNCFWWSNIQI